MIKTGDMSGDEIARARVYLGQRWGLGRPLSPLEMARSLGLSPTNGDDHVRNMENGKSKVSGSIAILVKLYLDGIKPPAECEVYRGAGAVSDYEFKRLATEQAAEEPAPKKRGRKRAEAAE